MSFISFLTVQHIHNKRLVYLNWIIRTYPNFLNMGQAERLKIMLSDKRVILKSGLFIQNFFCSEQASCSFNKTLTLYYDS